MRRRAYGVTLIELMVVGFIVMTIAAGIFVLLRRLWDNYDALLTQNLVQRQARAAMDIVVDELRTVDWSEDNLVVMENADGSGSLFGQVRPSSSGRNFVVKRAIDPLPDTGLPANQLIRAPSFNGIVPDSKGQNVVNNIARFQIVYERRVPSPDGSIVWQRMPDPKTGVPPIHHFLPYFSDPRIRDVVTAYVTVTASHRGMTGILYTCTLTSAVKIRNQPFSIVSSSQ
jgi:hypothetical protein